MRTTCAASPTRPPSPRRLRRCTSVRWTLRPEPLRRRATRPERPTRTADREDDMTKSRWSFKTAGELVVALANRQVSAVELAQDVIARIERHDTKINAVCVRDFERALDAARAADA